MGVKTMVLDWEVIRVWKNVKNTRCEGGLWKKGLKTGFRWSVPGRLRFEDRNPRNTRKNN